MINNIKNILKKEYFIREIITLALIMVSMLGFVMYESLALFSGTVEKTGVASIQAGLVTFEVTSKDPDYNSTTGQITIPSSTEKFIDLNIKNTTPISTKYKAYYNLVSPTTLPTGVTIGISSLTPNQVTEIINTNETKTVRYVIDNTSTQDITLKLGVEGGYSHNEVVLNNENNEIATIIEEEFDRSGANEPILASGMIPVVYDETSENWEVADTNGNWYSYSRQMWANAVTVNDADLRSATAGTEIPMEKINSMWVWIPRYKYRIPSNIGSSSDVTNPPKIDVVFETGINVTGESLADCPIDATDCYYTHPAFRNGSKAFETTAYDQGGWDREIEGIWVAKFETGTTDSFVSEETSENKIPMIKPNIRGITLIRVKTAFAISLKFTNGIFDNSTGEVTFEQDESNIYGLNKKDNTIDSHMMKNTEWGAVAYLSQSEYGKMGNLNYSGIDKEVYINNSYGSGYFITGRSGGGPSGYTPANEIYTDTDSTLQRKPYGFYTYDNYLLNFNTNTKGNKVSGKGTGASTTGTIYGIYDMSGGLYEYTMSNFNESYSASSFSQLPSQKYLDKYITESGNIVPIKGDATYETQNWYSDKIQLGNSPSWISRGGSSSMSEISTGIFYINQNTGGYGDVYGFRNVLIPPIQQY